MQPIDCEGGSGTGIVQRGRSLISTIALLVLKYAIFKM